MLLILCKILIANQFGNLNVDEQETFVDCFLTLALLYLSLIKPPKNT